MPSTSPSPLALPVLLAGIFMVTLDFFIVNVAIPSMQLELGASAASMELVVALYGVAFASGLVLAGRTGDLLGRRRSFAAGLALFTLTSLACGAAPGPGALVACRALQGASAALMSAQVLSMIGVLFTGEQRVRALTAYGLVAGLAAVGGQLIGGALTELDVAGLGWRLCFLINVPVGLAVLALVPRVLADSRTEDGDRLDLGGAALVTVGLVALVLPLVEGREHGWPLWTWLSLAGAADLLVLFALRMRRLARRDAAPLVDPALFAQRSVTVGALAAFVFCCGLGSFFFVLALYLQQGHGLGALDSGLAFTPLAAGYFVASAGAPALRVRLGRGALLLGSAALLAGLLALELTVEEVGVTGAVLALEPALVVVGVGMGLLFAPLITTVLAHVEPRHAGAASGVLSTVQQVGGAVGIALVGIVFYGALDGRGPEAVGDAFGAAVAALAVLPLLVAGLVALLPRHTGAAAAAPVMAEAT